MIMKLNFFLKIANIGSVLWSHLKSLDLSPNFNSLNFLFTEV